MSFPRIVASAVNKIGLITTHRPIISNMFCGRRWSSSSPSQLPVEGESGWKGFLKNVEKKKHGFSIIPQKGEELQKMAELSKRVSEMEQLVLRCLRSQQALEEQMKKMPHSPNPTV